MKFTLASFAALLCFSNFAMAFPTNDPIPAPVANYVEYYQTDNCTGAILGITDSKHSCELLATPPAAAWSIQVNGVCLNIVDMPAVQACERFSRIDYGSAIYFYTTDNCSATITAVVDNQVSCDSLDPQRSVWSIFKNNRCMNIVDTNEVVACHKFR